MQNSLVQTVLKLTMPGVPDIYQGTELWDLSMVDPDNRRPVDFERRMALIDAFRPADARRVAVPLEELLASWPDGRIKLALTAIAARPPPEHAGSLRTTASYEPLRSEGTGRGRDLRLRAPARGHDVWSSIAARFPARREESPLTAEPARPAACRPMARRAARPDACRSVTWRFPVC